MYIRDTAISTENTVNNTNNAYENSKVKEEESIFSSQSTDNDFTEELITTILDCVLDEIFSDGAFTKDEASTFVAGEKELAQIIKDAKSKQGFFESLFDFGSTEKKCREDYAKSHPEYAKVMKEGQKVQSEYENAMKTAKEEWTKSNPQPETLYEEGGLLGMKRTEEYSAWQKELTEFLNEFEKEYIYNNSDYKTLRTEQNKDKDVFDEFAQGFISSLVDSII